ncbi:MAG: Type 1 glutamine amidotransferase-like domain-containing protein [Candidatus Parcubacteria bacterium]|nr:Type 1 glutamine amidotransferase-like domain-containing protein [Candidatus Parcubacteria bacterium]
MRLYLSSYKLGKNPEKLSQLVGLKKHAGIILNAGHPTTKAEHFLRFKKNKEYLKTLGFTSEDIDLKNYFGKSAALKKKLTRFNLILVKGGNIFFLQRAFEQSGFNIIIKELLKNDSLVYAGESAGAVIAGPSLKGLHIVDNAIDVPKGYLSKFSNKGLGLINYMIAPHHKSNHPESPSVDKLIKYFCKRNIKYKALKDGEVIIINKPKK